MLFSKRVKFIHVLPIILAACVAMAIWLYPVIHWKFVKTFSNKTVEDRVTQYGPGVRARLGPLFKNAGVQYPPRRAVLLALKDEKRLELWVGGQSGGLAMLKSYFILGASGSLGPKLREGDEQVPEGLYRIESLNPNSLYHLALRLNYPNEADRARARSDGRANLGGDIMIHGGRGSVGCLAMGDEASEDLFVLAAETGIDNVSVILSPVDFRTRDFPEAPAGPGWTPELYSEIKAKMRELAAE